MGIVFMTSNEPNLNLVFKWVKVNGFCHNKYLNFCKKNLLCKNICIVVIRRLVRQ